MKRTHPRSKVRPKPCPVRAGDVESPDAVAGTSHAAGPPAATLAPPDTAAEGDPICPLCLRPIPPGVPQSRHHLVPRLRGGKHGPTVLLHQVCHSTIHATIGETDLARHFASVEALRAHPVLARFAAWVAKRPPEWRGRVR